MECPACTKTMEQQSYRGGVNVDKCLWCGGVWFDVGELEAYRASLPQRPSGDSIETANFERTTDSAGGLCPRCEGQPLVLGRASGIELGRCERCRGVHVSGEQMAELTYNTSPDTIGLSINALLDILPSH